MKQKQNSTGRNPKARKKRIGEARNPGPTNALRVAFNHGEDLAKLIQKPWQDNKFWPTKDLQGTKLKEPTRAALAITKEAETLQACDEMHIYTDNSVAEKQKARWGMAVLGVIEGTTDYKYMGTAGGRLRVGDIAMGDPKAEDIANAEVAAVLTAIKWVLQLKPKPAHLTIHTDSLLTAGAVEGHAGWPQAPDMFQVLQAYHRTAKELMAINMQHIKGHVDRPWNEMADAIANAARKET